MHVLICPLDWGLGHASRCIPIIQAFLGKGACVILAASGNSLSMLRVEFPGLEFIDFQGFSPEYPKNGAMIRRMIRLIPSFLWHIFSEHRRLYRIILERDIDIVISDNRYGLWNKRIKSILITHQVFIKSLKGWQWINPVIYWVNRALISKFDECWIPDFAGNENLSGELSHLKQPPANCHFIGPLSRMNHLSGIPGNPYGILVLLSGPEPQRSILESTLMSQLVELDTDALVICGKIGPTQQTTRKGKLTILNFSTSDQINIYLQSSSLVICRPGYSTIMDLATTGGKALFIPTPGQTEQEYLGEYYMKRGIALSVDQNDICLRTNLSLAFSYSGFEPFKEVNLYEKRIEMLSGE